MSGRNALGSEPRLTPVAVLLAGGLLVWAGVFLFSYVFAALACARGFAGARFAGFGVVPVAVTVATLAGLFAIAILATRARRQSDSSAGRRPALRAIALFVCVLAATGLVWNALPAILVSAGCR
jgi:hypothetical protein